jgi:hypothetical protein
LDDSSSFTNSGNYSDNLHIYVGDKLCALVHDRSTTQDGNLIQEYNCNMLRGTSIKITRLALAKQTASDQLPLRFCGVRVWGKTTASCEEMHPNYSDIACQVAGRIDVLADKREFNPPQKYNYDQIVDTATLPPGGS